MATSSRPICWGRDFSISRRLPNFAGKEVWQRRPGLVQGSIWLSWSFLTMGFLWQGTEGKARTLNILNRFLGLLWCSLLKLGGSHGTSKFQVITFLPDPAPPSSHRSNLRQPPCQHHTWLGDCWHPLVIGYSLLWQMASLDDLLVKNGAFP